MSQAVPISEPLPDAAFALADIVDAVAREVRDKRPQVCLALAAFLSGGHVLIEDAPGMGKTSLARALALHLSLDWKRLQCTNDTVPSDIVGFNVFDPKSGAFDFRAGPLFTQLLLVDELNRAPSKSQSALLEAMAEGQVTIDGAPHSLPSPFIVIATQNPQEQIGVSPLPESQLDRFAVSFSLGLPSAETETAILRATEAGGAQQLGESAVLATGMFEQLQQATHIIGFGDPIIDYVQRLAAHFRANALPALSVRALIQIKGLAQAYALIEQRAFCVPEDVQAVLVGALRHRMPMSALEAENDVRAALEQVAVP